MNKKKVFCDNYDFGWADTDIFEICFRLEDADIVILGGGADVNPNLYGAKKSVTTSTSDAADDRDLSLFKRAKENNIMLFGICRGSQFLTAMAGGKLWQDTTGHAGGRHRIEVDQKYHDFIDVDPIKAAYTVIDITSTHHQMMNPYGLKETDYELIAWSYPSRSAYYIHDDDRYDTMPFLTDKFREPEMVYYKNIHALAVQGHPESMGKFCAVNKFLNKLIYKLLSK